MKCKECKEPIDHNRTYPGNSIVIPYCTLHLSIVFANKAKKERIKKETASFKEMKIRVGNKRSYKQVLQDEVNKLVKMIDFGYKCISCGKGEIMYAGHYHTVKSCGNIRYNLLNIWNQCYGCNNFLSANKTEYKAKLNEMYGHELTELITIKLPSLYPVEHLKRFDLKQKIELVRKLIRSYEPRHLSMTERLSERIRFNQLIGIYA